MKTKHAFKYAALLLLLFTTLNSCSSDNGDGGSSGDIDYYIRYEVNGTLIEFLFNGDNHIDNAYGNFNLIDSGNNIASIAAGRHEIGNDESLLLSIRNPSEIQINTTYSNYMSATTTQPEVLLFTYLDTGGTSFGTFNEDDLTNLYPAAVANAKILFSEVTTTYMKGTFSGRFYNSNDNYIEITNGEFKVIRSDL
ncbi:hypothetical protein ACFS5M_09175 [Lacinutrix iliipiscaria]|uniref:Uncharacterized protein n=1 Tax=Lacinutrix iliipiscaria TaxID=1230532 RepID=A0ABW5WN18_9FLAO